MRSTLTVLVAGVLAVFSLAGTAAAEEQPSQEPDSAVSAQQPITLKMATVPPPAGFKVPAGYQVVNRGLDTVYCTSIAGTGGGP